MGVHDEHWCSSCRKYIDKTKDRYYEVDVVNVSERECQKEGKHARGFMCSECYDKPENSAFRDAVEKLRKKGNPTFRCRVECESTAVCADHKPAKDKRVNCDHIFVLNDKLYCGRRHPGKTVVGQDKAAVDQDTLTRVSSFIGKTVKQTLPGVKGDPLKFAAEALGFKSPVSLADFRPVTPEVILPEPKEAPHG